MLYKNGYDLVGGTPLLELTHIEKELNLKAKLFAKVEYFNPAGSVKDRIALSMIRGIGFRTMTGKYRVFYILVRIFGLVAIIEGAILGTIGLVSGISTIVSYILYGVVL